jgi:hypothetical protein
MPADITTYGQPENTLSKPSQHVWEALSPACRAPPRAGAQRHVHLELPANHRQARSPDQGRYGRAVLFGPSSTAALSTIWHVSAVGIAIRVGPHIDSRCVCSVLLRAIGELHWDTARLHG